MKQKGLWIGFTDEIDIAAGKTFRVWGEEALVMSKGQRAGGI